VRTLDARLTILRPGLSPYAEAYELQGRTAASLRAGGDATLILLEHPPTYTLGSRGDASNILASESRLRALGAEVVRTDRGGDVTFHGPQQIVGYPIVDLRAIHIGVSEYVCGLEAMLIEVLARSGIAGERSARNRGVWVDGAKVAAIGVRVSRGITTHGFALNVNTDLSWFEHIVPCGLADVQATSMEAVTATRHDVRAVQDAIVEAFAAQFGLRAAEVAEAVA
jgi:lipoate-protein ligase B